MEKWPLQGQDIGTGAVVGQALARQARDIGAGAVVGLGLEKWPLQGRAAELGQ